MSGLTTVSNLMVVDSSGGLHVKRIDSQGYSHLRFVIDSNSLGDIEVELLSIRGIPNAYNTFDGTWKNEAITNTGEILTLDIPKRGRPVITRNYPLIGVEDIGIYNSKKLLLLDSGDVYLSINGWLVPMTKGITHLVQSYLNGLMINIQGQLIKYSRSKEVEVLYQGVTDVKLVRENVIVLNSGVVLAVDYLNDSIVRYDIDRIVVDIVYESGFNTEDNEPYMLILGEDGTVRQVDCKTGEFIENQFFKSRDYRVRKFLPELRGFVSFVTVDNKAYTAVIGGVQQLDIPSNLL